jgi:hypothetical protein
MLLLLCSQPGAAGFELKHQMISFNTVSSLQETDSSRALVWQHGEGRKEGR